MQEAQVHRAVAAAMSAAASNGLTVGDAIVLQNSNKVAVRLLPCDVMARVALGEDLQPELELAHRLADAGAPVAEPAPRVDPGVHQRDGFGITLWTFYESAPELPPAEYADALQRLHAVMRTIDVAAPRASDRVASARSLLADRDRTPELGEPARELLDGLLQQLEPVLGDGNSGQLLHGEPHPGNILATRRGPLFIDLETCCRGPIEFDLAHVPDEVAEHYPGVDPVLLHQCRLLALALVTTWRWDRDDQLPDGHRLADDWLRQLRSMLDRDGMH